MLQLRLRRRDQTAVSLIGFTAVASVQTFKNGYNLFVANNAELVGSKLKCIECFIDTVIYKKGLGEWSSWQMHFFSGVGEKGCQRGVPTRHAQGFLLGVLREQYHLPRIKLRSAVYTASLPAPANAF